MRFYYDANPTSTECGHGHGLGRLCRIEDASGGLDYIYDVHGNIVQTRRTEVGHTYVTGYAWDIEKRLIGMRYPNGHQLDYSRDALGRIAWMSHRAPTSEEFVILDQVDYRADGLVAAMTYGNGIYESRTYDLQGRRDIQSFASRTRDYGYDYNGNVTSLNTSTSNYAYQYDELDRLVRDDFGVGIIDFSYDPNGNRQAANSELYAYQANSNRLADIDGEIIVHDPAGNRISDGNGSRAFSYNNAGRLFQIHESGNLVATYTYNALGQRTRKVTSSGTTLYHYDLNGQLIYESSASNEPITAYAWKDSEPVAFLSYGSEKIGDLNQDGNVDNAELTILLDAIVTQDLVADLNNDGIVEGEDFTVWQEYGTQAKELSPMFVHTDHLGTPRYGTDTSGQVVWAWESDGFGTTPPQTDVDGDGVHVRLNMRFPGQYFDGETALHYNYHRYYEPETGRYVTSDPIGVRGGKNSYLYVSANPLHYRDFYGLLEDWEPGDETYDDDPRTTGCRACAEGIARIYRRLPINDKYKHCVVSGEIARKCGKICAGAAGIGKEVQDMFGPGNAEIGDLIADKDGIACADDDGGMCPPQPVADCCKRKGYSP